jgi:hypothetical protein
MTARKIVRRTSVETDTKKLSENILSGRLNLKHILAMAQPGSVEAGF